MENGARQAVSRDFFHHLRDTLVLLGADVRFADLIEYPDDITHKDLDELRRFNGNLAEAIKTKMTNLNKLAVEVLE